MVDKRLEAAAKAYHAVKPLHSKFVHLSSDPKAQVGGLSVPIPWEDMKNGSPVRQKSVDEHMKAIAAAIKAYTNDDA